MVIYVVLLKSNNIIEKYFITYQQALTLKELGFNEPCFGFFIETGKWYPASYSQEGTVYPSNSDLLFQMVSAPLKQQVFRWFEDEYGLEGVVQRAEDHNWYKFNCYHLNENGKSYVSNMVEFKSREEAEEKCVDMLINLLRQRINN